MQDLRCWKCGAQVDEPMPLARAAACTACRADLHVCRACLYYDPAVARSCREPVADDVQDKTRANFCGYFQWRADAWQPADSDAQARSRTQLDALFGSATGLGNEPASGSTADPARSALEELFGGDPGRKKAD